MDYVHDLSGFHDYNPVNLICYPTMHYRNNGVSAPHAPEKILHPGLRGIVQSGRCFIQDIDGGLSQENPGQGDLLPLAAGQIFAHAANLEIKPSINDVLQNLFLDQQLQEVLIYNFHSTALMGLGLAEQDIVPDIARLNILPRIVELHFNLTEFLHIFPEFFSRRQ
jgi:hypothetical protein